MGTWRLLATDSGWVNSVQVMVEEGIFESVIFVFSCILSLLWEGTL